MNSTRRTQGDRGSVLPLVALCMVMLITMAAFAIDLGSARQAKAQVQSTTDAAALAGAQSLKTNGNGPDGMKKAIYDAADWAFRNLNMTVPTPTANCASNTTCYSKGDSNNTVVKITNPYTPSRLPTDTWDPSDFIHVQTCYDNPTSLSGVIGIRSVRVCSDATARMVGIFNPNSDTQDSNGDPFAMCTTVPNPRLFDTTKWFPDQNLPTSFAGHNNFGATYLYTSDLGAGHVITDPTSVKFVISSTTAFRINNGNFPDAQLNSTIHVLDESSPLVTAVYKSTDAQGRNKWELKMTNFTTVDAQGKGGGAKNWQDTLPDGQYTFSVYARALDGTCDQEIWSATIGTPPPIPGGNCVEDLFRGGTTPPSGIRVGKGTNYPFVTATYYDETAPYRPSVQGSGSYSSDTSLYARDLQFSLTGPDPLTAGNPDKTWDIVKDGTLQTSQPGLTGWSFTFGDSSIGGGGLGAGNGTGAYQSGGSGEYKWVQQYKFVLPDNLIDGKNYSLQIKSYDSDQNKAGGGDCGFAKWTVNYTNGKGQIVLWD